MIRSDKLYWRALKRLIYRKKPKIEIEIEIRTKKNGYVRKVGSNDNGPGSP